MSHTVFTLYLKVDLSEVYRLEVEGVGAVGAFVAGPRLVPSIPWTYSAVEGKINEVRVSSAIDLV